MPDRYPETLAHRVPADWRAKPEALAEANERSLAGFLREHTRRLLKAAGKRAQRRRQSMRRAS